MLSLAEGPLCFPCSVRRRCYFIGCIASVITYELSQTSLNSADPRSAGHLRTRTLSGASGGIAAVVAVAEVFFYCGICFSVQLFLSHPHHVGAAILSFGRRLSPILVWARGLSLSSCRVGRSATACASPTPPVACIINNTVHARAGSGG